MQALSLCFTSIQHVVANLSFAIKKNFTGEKHSFPTIEREHILRWLPSFPQKFPATVLQINLNWFVGVFHVFPPLFDQGFNDVFPLKMLQVFDERELEVSVTGRFSWHKMYHNTYLYVLYTLISLHTLCICRFDDGKCALFTQTYLI